MARGGVDGEGSKDLFLSVPGFGDSADSQGMPNTTTAKTIGAPELAEQQLASVQAAVERLSGMLVGGLSEAERAQITARVPVDLSVDFDQTVWFHPRSDKVHFFDPQTTEAVRCD